MLFILEIALGIVLGFLILSNLEAVLGLALLLLGFGVALAAVGAMIYWANDVTATGVLFVIFCIGLIRGIPFFKSEERKGLVVDDILHFSALIFLLMAASFALAMLDYTWSSVWADTSFYLYLLPIIGPWLWLGYAIRSRSRARIKSAQGAELEAQAEKEAAFKVFLVESLERRRMREGKSDFKAHHVRVANVGFNRGVRQTARAVGEIIQ